MKPKTLILMVLAVACGLGASYMTSRLLADRVEPDKEMVEILVARKNLSVGQHLAKPEEFFEKKSISKGSETPDAINDFETLKNKILKQGRNKGEAVTAANIFSDKEQVSIPEGFQAIGLRVNLETSASGLNTLPHSRVDVLYTQRGQTLKDSSCFYLLQDILVLAADGKIERDGVTAVAQVVTLALTPEDVLRLNLAKDTGIINLSLRNLGDRKIRQVAMLTGDKLIRKDPGSEDTGTEPAPTVEKTKPAVVAQKEPTPVEPVVETPKGTPIRLDIFNGTRQSSVSARIHAGSIIDEESSSAPPPAQPIPPQPRKNGPIDQ